MTDQNKPHSSLPPETQEALFELARLLQKIHIRLVREAREKELLSKPEIVDIKTAWQNTMRKKSNERNILP